MTDTESQKDAYQHVSSLKLLPELETMINDLSNYALEDVITFLRKLIWKYFEFIEKEMNNPNDWGKAMEILSRAAARLGRLVEIRKKICDSAAENFNLHQEVIDILAEIDQLVAQKENSAC